MTASAASLQSVRQRALQVAGRLPDPEIPVLTLSDLGVIRDVIVSDHGIVVEIAPTYSACPATEFIEQEVVDALTGAGFGNVTTRRVLTPPWTTDWISDEGRRKLTAWGIVPPDRAAESKRGLLHGGLDIACPRCGSTETSRVSEFGSTPCKASYKCSDCLEPFEYFKCL